MLTLIRKENGIKNNVGLLDQRIFKEMSVQISKSAIESHND